jgi:hypothetical protein
MPVRGLPGRGMSGSYLPGRGITGGLPLHKPWTTASCSGSCISLSSVACMVAIGLKRFKFIDKSFSDSIQLKAF